MQSITEKDGENRFSLRKIIALTSVNIFSLFALFLGTMSWFSAMRQSKAAGDGFEVVGYDGLVEKVQIFETTKTINGTDITYNPIEGKSIEADVDSSGVLQFQTESDTLSLGVYDQMTNDTQSSYESGLLYRIYFNMGIYQNREDVNIQVSTSTSLQESMLYETLENGHRVAKNPIQNDNNKLSSIIGFRTDKGFSTFGTLSTSDGNTMLDTNSYKTTIGLWNKTSNNKPTEEQNYVDIICDYQSDFVELLYSLNLGNSVIQNIGLKQYIDFTKDWTISIR